MAPRRGTAVRVIAPEESFQYVPDSALQLLLQPPVTARRAPSTGRRVTATTSRSTSRAPSQPPPLPTTGGVYPPSSYSQFSAPPPQTAEAVLRAMTHVLHAFTAAAPQASASGAALHAAFPTQDEWAPPSPRQPQQPTTATGATTMMVPRRGSKRSRSNPMIYHSQSEEEEDDGGRPARGLLLRRGTTTIGSARKRSVDSLNSSRLPSSTAGRGRSQSLVAAPQRENSLLQSYREASAMRLRSQSVGSHQPRNFASGNGWKTAASQRAASLDRAAVPSVALPPSGRSGKGTATTTRRSTSRSYLPPPQDGSGMFSSGLASLRFDQEQLSLTNHRHTTPSATIPTATAAAAARCYPQWTLIGTFKSSLDTVVQVHNGTVQWHQRNPKGGFQQMRVPVSLMTDVSVTRVSGMVNSSASWNEADGGYHVVVVKTVTKPSQVSFGFTKLSDAFQWKQAIQNMQKMASQ